MAPAAAFGFDHFLRRLIHVIKYPAEVLLPLCVDSMDYETQQTAGEIEDATAFFLFLSIFVYIDIET